MFETRLKPLLEKEKREREEGEKKENLSAYSPQIREKKISGIAEG